MIQLEHRLLESLDKKKRKGTKELTWMVNGCCFEVDNAQKNTQMQNVRIFGESENAETKFPKFGKCECNCCYTHLSSF